MGKTESEGQMTTSAKDAHELLPCPFCGGKAKKAMAITSDGELTASVVCESCQIGIFHVTLEGDTWEPFRTYDEATAAWNTRAERTCHNVNINGYAMRFECSECGFASIVTNCESRMDELPNYCPNCGARIEVGR